MIVGNIDGLERGGSAEDRGIEVGKARGNGECFKCRAARKRLLADDELVAVVKVKIDGGERCVVVERLRSDVGHGRRDGKRGDVRLREGVLPDGFHIVRNGVVPRDIARDEYELLALLRDLAGVVQDAVMGTVYRVDGVARLVNDDLFKRGAAFKRRGVVNELNGIGDLDGAQRRLALERPAFDDGDGLPFICFGDDDPGNARSARRDGDRIGARIGAARLFGEGENGDPVGIERPVARLAPCGKAIAVGVGVLHARAVGSAEPAHKCLGRIGIFRYGKLIFLRVRHAVLRSVHGAAVRFHIVGDGIGVGRPACIQHGIPRNGERRAVRKLVTVGRRRTGHIVPAAQREPLARGRGKHENVAVRKVHRIHTGTLARVKRQLIGVHADRLPCGRRARIVGKTHGDDILPRLRQGDGGIVGTCGHGDGHAFVHAHLIARSAHNVLPRHPPGGIDDGGRERIAAHGERAAPSGAARPHRPHAQFVLGAVGEPGGGEVVLRTVRDGIFPAAHADGVRRCTVHRLPREHAARHFEGAGCGKSCSGIGIFARRRGVISLRCGRNTDRQFGSAVAEQGDLRLSARRERVGSTPPRDLHGIVRCFGNGVPAQRLRLFVKIEGGNGVQIAFETEGLGHGGGAPRRRSRDGEGDAALLHGAVGEVEPGGSAVVERAVFVLRIAAGNGDLVIFRTLHRIEGEHGRFDDAEQGDPCKRLVIVVTHRRFRRFGIGHADCTYADAIFPCVQRGKIHRNAR